MMYYPVLMQVVVSLLRGINVGGHHLVKMDALREIYTSLKLRDPKTLLQSGNVVFTTSAPNLAALPARIEAAIEAACGFRPAVILRTAAELREVVAASPFANRLSPDGAGLHPAKIAVSFLPAAPTAAAREKALAIPSAPDELHFGVRELYLYFPNGMGRPTLSLPKVERALGMPGTARNWNTVTKLLDLADSLS